jgi:hypothetical protein
MNMRKAILVAAAAAFFGGGIASARDRLEVADLQCISGITFSPTQLNQPITFALLAGVQGPGIVGTAISVSGSQFTSIVLQPGIYRISWEIDEGPILPGQTAAGAATSIGCTRVCRCTTRVPDSCNSSDAGTEIESQG